MLNKNIISNTKNNVPVGLTRYILLFISKVKSLFPINFPRLITTNYLVSFVASHIVFYPSPAILTYAWSFGSLAGLCLVIQILSGIFLSMHYTANIDLAFSSIEYIMRDVPNGWLVRYLHANGASMFFITVYAHICRGLYYGSYMKPRQLLWCSGVIILLLMMGTAFTGARVRRVVEFVFLSILSKTHRSVLLQQSDPWKPVAEMIGHAYDIYNIYENQ